jgi:hypothetical protein
MLRISAGMAIVVGLVLAIETFSGMSNAYRYSLSGEGTYIAEHFALQWAFVVALVGGGVLAFWRGFSVLLAAAWGIVLGLDAPQLIRPPIPAALMQTHGAVVHVVGANVGQYLAVALALLGLVLCAVAEWQRASKSNLA